jgi:hypothetical protein
MFRTCLKTIAFALLCLPALHAVAQTTSAQDRWYEVELLVFKYNNPEEFAAENWPERWSLPDTRNSVDIEYIDDKYRADFQGLGTRSFGGMQERLDKSVRYEVLNHSVWRQRGLGREQAVGVRLRAGRRYLPQAPVPVDSEFGLFEQGFIEQGFLPEVTLRRYSETTSKGGNVLHELEGEIKIVLSRYLHVYTDLLLLKPVTLTPVEAAQKTRGVSPGGGRNPLTGYRVDWAPQQTGISGTEQNLYGFNIKTHRRMRSGELHHLDHPLLGVLIQVKPVETAKP